jgi:pimeloyl-ACP methyl ester carboxylesterase
MFGASGNRRCVRPAGQAQQGGSAMTISLDGCSRDEAGDIGLSRRDAVKGAGALALATAMSTTSSVAGRSARAQVPATPGQVTTSDGVQLHYLEAGSGKPILMIPGWSQSAEQFKYQLSGLSDRYRVIAVDMRGHGESDKPEFGYKISRLAKDVRDMIEALDLDEVNILGHSMGSSVIWNYYDMFGPERLSKLLLIDQMPMITSNPVWSEQERIDSGAIFDPQSLYETINALAGPDGVETTRGFIGNMVTKSIAPEEKEWIIERNLRMPRHLASTLLYNHATQDWRDLIPRLELPTLVVGGRVSVVPWRSQEWVAEQIPGARLEIFEEEEGGNHFMFIEGHDKFNAIVADFVG